jgi:hypothetical protein
LKQYDMERAVGKAIDPNSQDSMLGVIQ